ncbi:hypothetical protein L2E82_12153 [Cichorium intybus]|uniref:Uncharacterized protein n=1 Tax=Cichorium intybus TaxID=13427 RepID=A0ACB9GGH1_CICIN|nr:hypothetical protein L2E82_12153 [Cichorium intybus]
MMPFNCCRRPDLLPPPTAIASFSPPLTFRRLQPRRCCLCTGQAQLEKAATMGSLSGGQQWDEMGDSHSHSQGLKIRI